MTENDALHIVRNPWGHTAEEQREAALELADRVDRWRRAYHNMRDFAEANGLDTVARSPSREEYGK